MDKIVGVYIIKNLINNKVYVGGSVNIKARFIKHRTELKNRIHSNKYLTEDYHNYGFSNFEFTIIELCSKEDLVNREAFYLNKYNSVSRDFGYNLSVPKTNPFVKRSDEYSEILSKGKRGTVPKNYPEMIKARWKGVNVYVDGKLFKSFDSLRQAEIYLGIAKGNVWNYLNGATKKFRKFKNYHFEYTNKN